MTKEIWFKRKKYGYGWTPVTWQGWVVTGLYVVLVVVFAMTIDETSSVSEVMFTFVLPAALLTFTLIRIACKKGETPRWQWGNSSNQTSEDSNK